MNTTQFSSQFEGAFTRKNIRKDFIAKVFTLVGCQLLTTISIVTICRSFQTMHTLSITLAPLMAIVVIVMAFVMMCSRSMLKKVPTNYILLGVFTVAESVLLNVYLMPFNTELIMVALLITGLVVSVMGGIAFTTKTEFMTSKNVMMILLANMIFSFVSLLFFNVNNVVLSFLGAIVACVYLVIDIQMMMGNKQVRLEIDEYVFASINIYMDVIIIFKRILEVLDESNKKKNKK